MFMIVTPELIESFTRYLRYSDCAADTVRSYVVTIKRHCLGKSVKEINQVSFLGDMMDELRQKSAAKGTISRYVYAVKKFLCFLRDERGVEIFDLSRIKCKRAKGLNPDYLDFKDIVKVRAVPLDDGRYRGSLYRDRALFELLLYTGCRISEAMGILKTDLAKEITIIGKGNKKRVVSLGDSMAQVKKYLEVRGEDDCPYLFASREGSRGMNRSVASGQIRKLGILAGTSKMLRPHLLRHTCATYLIWNGVDARTVQEIMGHEDIQTTLRFYTAVSPDRMKQAQQRLSETLSVGLPS